MKEWSKTGRIVNGEARIRGRREGKLGNGMQMWRYETLFGALGSGT